MAPSSKNIVFDIVGTLIGYEHLWNAIDTRLGDKLRAEGVKPSLLGHLWIETAEREYTYLSMSGRYKPFGDIFELLFYRMLHFAGIKSPREFASKDDLAYIMAEYQKLEMRPGAKECVSKLREAGFTVWALTAADRKRVGAYFANAGVELPAENLISCDAIGVGKPDLNAYKPILGQLSENGATPWFAAGHMWDVSAARCTGFKGAYCSILEGEPLTDLFGDMEVIAETLPAMADKVIAAAS